MPSIPNPVTTTKAWRLAEIPNGDIDVKKHFTLDTAVPLPYELAENEVLLELVYFSNDPGKSFLNTSIAI